MRIKEGFILRKVGIQYIVAATGEASKEFNGMLRLNRIGAFLWEQLTEERSKEQLLRALMDQYEVDENTANTDVDDFLSSLKGAGIIA